MKQHIVRFSQDSDRYYDLSDGYIHKWNGEIIRHENYSSTTSKIFELLLANRGNFLSYDTILDKVDPSPDCKMSKSSVTRHIHALRSCLDPKYGINEIIETKTGVGYRYIGVGDEYIGKDILPGNGCELSSLLSNNYLTDNGYIELNPDAILHREREQSEIKTLLSAGNSHVLITGFGGIGKTYLARSLYKDLGCVYDIIGWVYYDICFKSSLLSSVDLYAELQDEDKRWNAVSRAIKQSTKRILLIVDNMNRDEEKHQDPCADENLQVALSWPNVTIIATSRLSEIPHFMPFHVKSLGFGNSRTQITFCSDLFYLFYDHDEYRIGRVPLHLS